MKHGFIGIISLSLIGLFLLGCTAVQQGAGVGAGVGALAGQAIGRSTGATLIGAGAGAVAGALVGDQIQEDRQRKAQAAAAQPYPQAKVHQGSHQVDPTLGEFINKTRWDVNVWIDSDPNRASENPSVVLKPSESLPVNLDIGQHRIYAVGYVQTQYGQRLAGQFDQMINVNAKGNGWSVVFTPGVFN